MASVWMVTSGCYSDYGVDGLFSTREKAQEYYEVQSVCRRYVHTPQEVELDRWDGLAPEYVTITQYNEQWMVSEYIELPEETPIREDDDGELFVRVKFNKDLSVMIKAAQDAYALYRAEKEGLV